MTELSDLLNSARGERSVRAIGRAVAQVGVGESTVIPYFNGSHGVPSMPVLEALARVLPVSVAALRAAADFPAGELDPYVPPAESVLLSQRQRRRVDELIRDLVRPSKGGDSGGS